MGVLAGCATSQGLPPHITVTATPTAPTPGIPVSVDIPSIGVHVTSKNLIPVGLNPDNTMATPDDRTPQVMGYYTHGAPPCQPGPDTVPAGLNAHIDGHKQQGALFNLKDIKPGATITVGLDNGTTCTYAVDELVKVSKTSFPTVLVWGSTPGPEIRVISCGGPFIGPPLGYRDNLIAKGHMVSSIGGPPP